MQISISTAREIFKDAAANNIEVSLVSCENLLTKETQEPNENFARLISNLTEEDGTLGRIETEEAFLQLDYALHSLSFRNQGFALLRTNEDRIEISIYSSPYDNVRMLFTLKTLSE